MADYYGNTDYRDYSGGSPLIRDFMTGSGGYAPEPTAPSGMDWKSLLLQGGAGAAAGGMMSGPVGAGLALAGTALQGYGQYKQMQEARKQYRQQVKAWEAAQAQQAREDAERQRQTFLGNALNYGSYATNFLNNTADRYGSYASKYGLTG